LSTKDRKILDLEKALAEQDDTSKKNMSEILEKLKLLFEEYKKSLNEFGVRPAPLPSDVGIPEFMDCMETEFKALSEVISGASDFAAAFSVESILKILHDFDGADLEKFREKISQFPSATSTSILRANEDVKVIKNKFARVWFASREETVKVIARAKLAEVNFCTISSLILAATFCFLNFPYICFSIFFQLNEEEDRENVAASPEESTSDEDSSGSGEEGSSSSSSSSSDEDSTNGQASGRDESSPKVDVRD
jgi:hypothetical protein